MGDKRSNTRTGGRKRIREGNKVPTQLLGLVPTRRALGVLQLCFREFLKYILRSSRLQTVRQMPETQNLLDLDQESRPDGSPSYPEYKIRHQETVEHRRHSGCVSNRGSFEPSARDSLNRKIEDIVNDPRIALHGKISQVCRSWNQFHTVQLDHLESEKSVLRIGIARIRSENEQLQTEGRLYHDRTVTLNREKQSLESIVAGLEEIAEEHESCGRKMEYMSATVAEFQERESYAKSKPGNAEVYAQYNNISGSYGGESATPVLLHKVLSITKTSVKAFQKAFVDAVNLKGDSASLVDLLYPDHFYARPSHVSFATRAAIHKVFFKGFENENFNTCCGDSSFLDPDVRRARFYDYYLREREQSNDTDLHIKDPQFETFCEKKVYPLWKVFNLKLESDKRNMSMTCLQELGGTQLLSRFRVAAKNVWLLHKLAFSFQSPASIFRVEEGADLNINYMEPMVSLEDHEKLVPRVGFMIAPGFRLGKTVLRCEVYLVGGK